VPVDVGECYVIPEADTEDRARFAIWWRACPTLTSNEAWLDQARRLYARDLESCEKDPEALARLLAACPEFLRLNPVSSVLMKACWWYDANTFSKIAERFKAQPADRKPEISPKPLEANDLIARVRGENLAEGQSLSDTEELERAVNIGGKGGEDPVESLGRAHRRYKKAEKTFPRVVSAAFYEDAHEGMRDMMIRDASVPVGKIPRLIMTEGDLLEVERRADKLPGRSIYFPY